jgi:hypothetical protein
MSWWLEEEEEKHCSVLFHNFRVFFFHHAGFGIPDTARYSRRYPFRYIFGAYWAQAFVWR